jgi:hypothetical protein
VLPTLAILCARMPRLLLHSIPPISSIYVQLYLFTTTYHSLYINIYIYILGWLQGEFYAIETFGSTGRAHVVEVYMHIYIYMYAHMYIDVLAHICILHVFICFSHPTP